jgi:hypothetical protein
VHVSTTVRFDARPARARTTSAAILEAAPAGREGATSASLQLAQVLGAALATGAGGALVAAPFAGDPPVLGIAIVDGLMLAITALALVCARGLSTTQRDEGSRGTRPVR